MVTVFVIVLARRLGRFAENRILTEVQGGFREGFGSVVGAERYM